MATKVKIDVTGALDHLEKQTGNERPSFYRLNKELGISANNFPSWERGEGLKTVEQIVKFSEYTGYPLESLIKIKKEK